MGRVARPRGDERRRALPHGRRLGIDRPELAPDALDPTLDATSLGLVLRGAVQALWIVLDLARQLSIRTKEPKNQRQHQHENGHSEGQLHRRNDEEE